MTLLTLKRVADPAARLGPWLSSLPFESEDLSGVECFEVEQDRARALLGCRGQRFAGDRIRLAWLLREAGTLELRRLLPALKRELPQRGIVAVRWVQPWSRAERHHRAWLRLGARTVDVDWSAEARWVTFQLDARPPVPTVRTRRGHHLGPPLLSEWQTLERWSRDPRVVEPLRLDQGLSRDELMRHAYGSLRTALPRRAQLWMVRRQGRPVGVSLEYVWHYAGDGVREIDTAVPDTEPSPKLLLDAIAGAMHLAYATGATETIGNVRQPFPRLFARVGGSDRTGEIGKFGRGLPDRFYYVASADEFYRSREGRAFSALAGAGAA